MQNALILKCTTAYAAHASSSLNLHLLLICILFLTHYVCFCRNACVWLVSLWRSVHQSGGGDQVPVLPQRLPVWQGVCVHHSSARGQHHHSLLHFLWHRGVLQSKLHPRRARGTHTTAKLMLNYKTSITENWHWNAEKCKIGKTALNW